MAMQSITSKLVRLAESEHAARGALAADVRSNILAGNWSQVGEAFGILLEKHGQRHSIGQEPITKKPIYSASTPADSLRATIHNVTVALAANRDKTGYLHGALKPMLFENSEGEEKWGLVDKGGKVRDHAKPSSVLSKHLDKAAQLCKTDDEKRAALALFAQALGMGV